MSKYTTQIRFICESAVPLEEQGSGNNVATAIESGRSVIFDFNYDLFDSAYKSVIETKFLRHNYVREIGFETVGLFKLRLQDEWIMKLPYYNKLWESALLEFNPFYDVDYKTQHSGTGQSNRADKTDNTRNDNTTATQNNIATNDRNASYDNTQHTEEDLLQKYSDTPQGGLDGVIDTNWLTNATKNDNERNNRDTGSSSEKGVATGSSNGTSNLASVSSGILTSNMVNTDAYLRSVVGKMGSKSYSKMLQEFRETFLNIDEMFINEFKKLFMLIY